MAKRDYYDVLGVSKAASEADLKSAYRKAARQLHPDVNKAADAEAKFKELQEAYDVVSNPQKKAQYDQFGHDAFSQGTAGAGGFGGFGGFGQGQGQGADFEDIFDMFFGGQRRRGGQSAQANRGDDLRVNLNITLEDAFKGIEKEIELSYMGKCDSCEGSGGKKGSKPVTCHTCGGSGQVRQNQRTILGSFTQIITCPTCGGQGKSVADPCSNCRGQGLERKKKRVKVQVPQGVDDGSKIRMSGAGNVGHNGGTAGDLYVVLNVAPHKYFQREGDDLICRMEINFAQAALGDEIEVPTIDGKVSLKIPAGTVSQAVFRLRGKGMPHLQAHGRGDQHVQVILEVPHHVSGREKELLEELKKIQAQKYANQSIFDRVKSIIS